MPTHSASYKKHVGDENIHVSEEEKKVIGELIEGGGIGGNTIQDGAISTVKLEDNAVTTRKINDLAVTGAKIGTNAVTADKMQNVGVLSVDIAIGSGARVDNPRSRVI